MRRCIKTQRTGLHLAPEHNINYCYGGNRPLAEAREERGLEPETVVTLLNASLDQRGQREERVAARRSSINRKTLAKDLLRHADEEETDLFPAVLEGRADLDTSGFLKDHEEVGAHLARIRELTDGHVAPEWASKRSGRSITRSASTC